GYPAQSLDVRVQPSELASQDLRLHFVEPAVVAWSAGDVVVLLHPVVAESAQGAFDPVVVGDDRTSVAVGAQDLRRVEGERGGVAHAPRYPAVVAASVCLGTVLQDHEAVLLGDPSHFGHVDALSVQVDRKQAPGTRGHGGLEL